MSPEYEQLQDMVLQFKSIPNVTNVKVEDPSDLINLQIDNKPSLVVAVTILPYPSIIPVTIKIVVPISVILRPGLLDIAPNDIDTLAYLAYIIAFKPFDNSVEDHLFHDNLTEKILTLYINPIAPWRQDDQESNVIPLKGVKIAEYQGDENYDKLLILIKQQPHVTSVVGNIVVDPKLIPDQSEIFIAFSIDTDILLKNADVHESKMGTTLNFMIIFNLRELNLADNIIKQINERMQEYTDLMND